MCINHETGMTLTFFTARSTLNRENCKKKKIIFFGKWTEFL